MSIPKPTLSRLQEVIQEGKTPHTPQKLSGEVKSSAASVIAQRNALESLLQKLSITPLESHRPITINLNGDGAILIAIPRPRTDFEKTGIDAIITSNGLPDHAHPQTLRTANPKTPVLAASDAVMAIRAWDHFDTVWPLPDLNLGTDSPLPSWLNVTRLPSPTQPLLAGILISWASSKPFERPEAILYGPHGVTPDAVEAMLVGSPIFRLLALLHPVHETFTENGPPSIGVDNGLKLYRLLESKYWIQVHDPDFVRSGILNSFQEYHERSLEEALEKNPGSRPNFRARANGDIFILE